MYSYEELLKLKENGENLNWKEITKEQLEKLFNENITDRMISELYNVSISTVRNKRKKFNISFQSPDYLYSKLIKEDSSLFDLLNQNAKERLMKSENIDWLAKALTHYVFRLGPVEDMHADNKLTQEDMKMLNKYMVNKFAVLLKLLMDKDFFKLEILLNYLSMYGKDWDKAEFDMEDVDEIFKIKVDSFIEKLKSEK